MRIFGLGRRDFRKVFDAVVVGSGLTGAWVAKELSEAGLEVAMLEAGPLLHPRNVAGQRWKRGWRAEDISRQLVQSLHPAYWWNDPRLFVDDLDNPYTVTTDKPFVWIRGRQVGGRSLTWGGISLRFSDNEFRAPDQDGFGSPWPLTHQDLSPYYEKVERFLGVQGSKDGLPQLPDGVFSRPPPLTRAEIHFKESVESRWNDRRVIICRGLPLQREVRKSVGARWPPRSNLSNTLPAALSTGRVMLLSDSIVSHLNFDLNTARPKSVVCLDRMTKNSFEVLGRTIILCASTIESIRIMLNSKTQQHPAGVGNSSGLLGRYLLDHMAVTMSGTTSGVQETMPHVFGSAHGMCIPRFRNLHSNAAEFIRGYGIWGAMQRGRQDSRRWFLTSQLEVLPRKENCVEIDEQRVDAWGIKVIKINFSYFENEWLMKTDAESSMNEMIDAARLRSTSCSVTLPGEYVHELGGARMGKRSSESVLNPFNQCWDAKNLFVLDGSCFVTSGWQNPSLTMMALAVRGAHFIVDAMKRGDI